ncbi:uncharacterized protein V6R79_020225 [Siganus canaliculatus]
MPRKGKKSLAKILHWKKVKDTKCAASDEPEHARPQSSEVEMVAECSTPCVKQTDQTNAACQPQLSYADVVKRGRRTNDPHKTGNMASVPHADGVYQSNASCVAGPSHAVCVNLEYQPFEESVCASRSQDSHEYGRNRNKQCTCNSLTFLGFLHENENLTREDLNMVLDKGNEMYTEARNRVPDHIYLTTDELPDLVPANRSVLLADMRQSSKYGTFGEPLHATVDYFLDLEAGMSCLLSDVQYALLLMRNLCIAVFRTRSGRYGFFDPHPRTASGLPASLYSHTPGTAVMVTFLRLSDMIDRLKLYHQMLGTQSTCNYELKPVTFLTLSDDAPDRESEATTETAAASPALLDHDPVQDTQTSPTQMNTVPDLMENTVHAMETETSDDFLIQYSDSSSKPPQCVPASSAPQLSSNNHSHDISSYLSRLNKQQRQKYKRRLATAEKVSKRKENQKRKDREKYATDETYRAKKKSHSRKRYESSELQQKKKTDLRTKYKVDADFKQRTKQYITSRYRTNDKFRQKQKHYITGKYRDDEMFRQKQKHYITGKYRDDEMFRQKQKDYITSQYRDNEMFRQKQKDYITSQYRDDEMFRQKQKDYITSQYRDDEMFRQKQKDYITSQYRDDEMFRQKQKDYITSKYRDSINFRKRQQSYMTGRYARDQAFRIRHRQLMKQRMQHQYKNNALYRRIHKMRCAMKILRKYRQIQPQQYDDMMDDDYDEDDLMEIDRFEANALCEPENDEENDEMVCADSQPVEQNDGAEAEESNPEQLALAKEKLRPLNQLLNDPETASLTFEQLLVICNLTESSDHCHFPLQLHSGPSQLCHHSTPERKVRIAQRSKHLHAENCAALENLTVCRTTSWNRSAKVAKVCSLDVRSDYTTSVHSVVHSGFWKTCGKLVENLWKTCGKLENWKTWKTGKLGKLQNR